MSERLTKWSFGNAFGVKKLNGYLAGTQECMNRLYEIEQVLYDADGNEVISLEELAQLLQSKREGRVVVLPKVGDRLFYAPYPKSTTGIDGEPLFLRNTGDGTGVVRRVVVAAMFDNWSAQVPLKRTWKTKAEAERALAATEPKGDATT